MKLKLLATSHHRNGVCGTPFNIHLFQSDGETLLGIDFGGMDFAVVDPAKAAAGDIAFGSNSFRGDHFAEAVRALAKKAKPAVADGALFVNWGVKK